MEPKKCAECGRSDVEFKRNRSGEFKVCNNCIAKKIKATCKKKRIKLARKGGINKLGFKVVQKSYLVCPHCNKVVGEAD